MRRTPTLGAAILFASVAPAVTAADDAPAVTPYRPSVSTPAALSAPGWLELEAGVQADRAGAASARRDSLPITLKLAFTPDWGVRFGGEAWVRQRDDAGAVSGAGDSSLVVKHRLAIDDASAFGIELGATVPSGRNRISSGKSDRTLTGIYSLDFSALHTDINLGVTRIGQVDAGASRRQTQWAASLSKSLDDQWGWVGEVSGAQQRGAGGSSQLLAAVSYNVSKAMTLDAGLARHLRAGEPRWSYFSGLTVLCGRLF